MTSWRSTRTAREPAPSVRAIPTRPTRAPGPAIRNCAAGIKFAFLSIWSAKVEYLCADLGSFDCSTACGGPAGGTDDVTFTANIVRIGVNYRF